MELRITEEQVQSLMEALDTNGHPGYIIMVVSALVSNQFNSEYWKDIPSSMKKVLTQKVLQYVARTALRGTIEIDGLAQSCGFVDKTPFSGKYDFTFTMAMNKQKIHVRVEPKIGLVRYCDANAGYEICNMPLDKYDGSLDAQIELIAQFENQLNQPTGLSFEPERRNTGVGSGLWIGERPNKPSGV